MFFVIATSLIIFTYRYFIKYLKLDTKKDKKELFVTDKINVIIYGAGDAGIKLNESLNKHYLYNVVGFIDDNTSLNGRFINKIEVKNRSQIKFLKDRYNVKGVIFAMPSVNENIVKAYSRFCLDLNLFVTKVPNIESLINGHNKINELKFFDSNDLLSREEVNHFSKKESINFKNLVVAITGGGGSIGSELCIQLLKLKVKK